MRLHHFAFASSLSLLACQQSASVQGSSTDTTSADLSARPIVWSAADVPTESVITGGPWTLEQSAAGLGVPAAGYCDAGVQLGNPGTERMQPYYFPLVFGQGQNLQGYFDYRPKDLDEAIVAATSTNGGHSWTFQQEVLELTSACPVDDTATNGGDDGQGHPFIMTVAGQSVLYTLDRTPASVDNAGLVVHALSPTPDAPLAPTPATFDVQTRTNGLLNPDGIFALVPNSSPNTVIYLQKQLGADTSFTADQQCPGAKANHDITQLRLAQTDDGINFTDLGPLAGLNDPTDVTAAGTRYVGPRGSIFHVSKSRWGMFFSGGTCADNDSDALHYIGYAESTDLMNWTVVNDITHAIVSINPLLGAPVVGAPQGWFASRVYSPNATYMQGPSINLMFAGYHETKPKHALGDYRSIGFVPLYASRVLPPF